ncbi:MAG: DUF1987 domain-containing protein [Bacteroidales bacterium]|nr:DUF1987 domain-containing protein [Bacteroidales bacterium]
MKREGVLMQGSKTLPTVILEDGRLNIRGRSIGINQQEWWDRLIQNLNILQITSKEIRELHIYLEYFNSETNRILMHIFSLIDKINQEENRNISIKWHCSLQDETLLEHISIFSSIVETPIEIVLE